MANHRSAAKRARQSLVRRARNRSALSTLRSAVKKIETAVSAKDQDAAKAALTEATAIIDRAACKRVLHKNTAARKVSRLTGMVNALA